MTSEILYPPLLPHTTHDLFTQPTTCLHHPRLVYTTHDLFTPPTTCLHHPQLVYTTHDLFTPPPTIVHTTTTCTHHLRLQGRESTNNCLESEGKSAVTSRCYVRRFLSDDSFAAIVTIPFCFLVLLHLYELNYNNHGLFLKQVVLARLVANNQDLTWLIIPVTAKMPLPPTCWFQFCNVISSPLCTPSLRNTLFVIIIVQCTMLIGSIVIIFLQ